PGIAGAGSGYPHRLTQEAGPDMNEDETGYHGRIPADTSAGLWAEQHLFAGGELRCTYDEATDDHIHDTHQGQHTEKIRQETVHAPDRPGDIEPRDKTPDDVDQVNQQIINKGPADKPMEQAGPESQAKNRAKG